MRVAIHQPHYFPWLGYMKKIAEVDAFVILDDVQFEKGSLMNRNRIIDTNGSIKYLTISADMDNYQNRPYRSIITKNDSIWKSRQENALENYYKKSNNANEAMKLFRSYLKNQYRTLNEWTSSSILLSMNILNITTPILFQSQIDYDRNSKKSDLVLSICCALGANEYYSGRGASMNYLNREAFAEKGINIIFQQFDHPVYNQCNSSSFIPGLSVLDLLFNYGADGTKQVFYG